MGDISIIARRLEDGHVQYGWSGNGGYFAMVGTRLLAWYQSPERVEYLFGLGELSLLGMPGSEGHYPRSLYSHRATGRPHNLGKTVREIFSRIAFVDYGYFYDLDKQWHYIVPGPFRIKIPLKVVEANLDSRGMEFAFINETEKQLTRYLLGQYGEENTKFGKRLREGGCDTKRLLEEIEESPWPMEIIYENKLIFSYFDDWVVALPDEKRQKIEAFMVKPRGKRHVETIFWK